MRALSVQIGVGVFKKDVALKDLTITWLDERNTRIGMSLDTYLLSIDSRIKALEKAYYESRKN